MERHAIKLSIIISLFWIQVTYAAQPVAAPQPDTPNKTKAQGEGRMDFEGDIIENDSRLPSILNDFDPQSLTLDLMIFKRKDFNDTHSGRIESSFNFQPTQGK